MVDDYAALTDFDPLIHQPSRLSIMAVLAGCERADFTYLVEATGLTKGTLSKHLSKLSDAGYVEIKKGYKGNYPHTSAMLSAAGSKAFSDYRRKLAAFNKSMGT